MRNYLFNNRRKKIIFALTAAFFLFLASFFYLLFPSKNAASAPLSASGSFGGRIFGTIDCSSPLSCVPTAPEFPVCLVIRCILGTPFIIQLFTNATDGSDALLNTIIEPQELASCPAMCTPLLISEQFCPFYCSMVLPGLQKADSSPAGIAYKTIKNSLGVRSTGILMALEPQNLLPACNAQRPLSLVQNVLGKGLQYGTGLYITQPAPPYNNVGDNCAGNYYPFTNY